MQQTQRSLGSHRYRDETVALTRSARRTRSLSRTDLDATQNSDLQPIVASEPGHSQKKFRTASLPDSTTNTDSHQRGLDRSKLLVGLRHYNRIKENLGDQEKTNSFLRSSSNHWKLECERPGKRCQLL